MLIRLAGKDEKGKTVQVELDGETPHEHKGSGNKGQKTISSTVPVIKTGLSADLDARVKDIQASLDYMNRKLDTIIRTLNADPLNDDGDNLRENPQV